MNILVSNDDGIQAEGIGLLVQALSALPKTNVYVAAPSGERSAAGHSISMRKALLAEKVVFPGAEIAYSIEGSPADCVKLGCYLLKKEGIKIDVVFSGVNHGGNMGWDAHYSGTVSAAMEGIFCGVPAVAISVEHHQPVNLQPAVEIGISIWQKVGGALKAGNMLNINLPDLPKEQLNGIKLTRLGPREYTKIFEERVEPDGRTGYWYGGEPVVYTKLNDEVDSVAVNHGFVSCTPLKWDLTDYSMLYDMQDWDEKWEIE